MFFTSPNAQHSPKIWVCFLKRGLILINNDNEQCTSIQCLVNCCLTDTSLPTSQFYFKRSIFWNVFLLGLHMLIQEAHTFHSKPFSLIEFHPLSLHRNIILFHFQDTWSSSFTRISSTGFISYFPALPSMSQMSNDMELVLAQVIFMGRKATEKNKITYWLQ